MAAVPHRRRVSPNPCGPPPPRGGHPRPRAPHRGQGHREPGDLRPQIRQHHVTDARDPGKADRSRCRHPARHRQHRSARLHGDRPQSAGHRQGDVRRPPALNDHRQRTRTRPGVHQREGIRRSHLGDWGTQFGTLIQYLVEPDELDDDTEAAEAGPLMSRLNRRRKASRAKLDSSPTSSGDHKNPAALQRLRLDDAPCSARPPGHHWFSPAVAHSAPDRSASA